MFDGKPTHLGDTMTTPLEIQFHGLDKSDAVEARVREKFKKLERHFDKITSARVVIEAPHRNPEMKVKVIQIKIEISVPGSKPIIVTHERETVHAHEDVMQALRDAFQIAQRHVDETAEKISTRAKSERGRRRPSREISEG